MNVLSLFDGISCGKLALEQAQTLPRGYTKSLSYNQACAVIGNGWTVDAVAHIFSHLKIEIQQTKAT